MQRILLVLLLSSIPASASADLLPEYERPTRWDERPPPLPPPPPEKDPLPTTLAALAGVVMVLAARSRAHAEVPA